jgi:cytochrome oxidase Cu insertion factor (SCO1/SenC/PrrC family)
LFIDALFRSSVEDAGDRRSDSIRWSMRPLLRLIPVLLLSAVALGARPEAEHAQGTAPDVNRLGPQVGERIPDFTLRDQNGRTRTLASLMGEKGLVLVFSRSADW